MSDTDLVTVLLRSAARLRRKEDAAGGHARMSRGKRAGRVRCAPRARRRTRSRFQRRPQRLSSCASGLCLPVLCSGSHETVAEVSARLCSLLKFETLFRARGCCRRQVLVVAGPRSSSPRWLAAQVCSPLLGATVGSSPCAPSILKASNKDGPSCTISLIKTCSSD